MLFMGCASQTEISKLSEDGWVVIHRRYAGELFYCRANKTEDGKAAPVCYQAEGKRLKDCKSAFCYSDGF